MYDVNTIEELTDKIYNNDYFIIAPKVVLPDGNIQESNKIERPSYIHYIKHETYLNRFFKDKNVEKEHEREVYWVAGCCFAVDLEKFKKINFFDENTLLYYEEYIISEKAVKSNFKILFVPSIEVIHYHGASMGDVNVNIFLEHFKSEMYFWIKYRKINKLGIFMLYNIRKLEIKISLIQRSRANEYKTYRNKSKLILKEIRQIVL